MGFNYTSTDWSQGIWSINLQAYLGSTDEGVNVTSRITSFPDQANTDSRVFYKLIYIWFSRNFYRFKSCFALWQSSHFCVWWKLIIVVVQCFRGSICLVTQYVLCCKWDFPSVVTPKGSQMTRKTYFCMILDSYRYWYLESGLTLIQETRCTTQVSVHSAQLVSTAFWWLSGDPLFTQRSPMYCGWHNSQHRLVRSKVRSLVLEIRWWPMLWKRVEKGKWWLFNKSEK